MQTSADSAVRLGQGYARLAQAQGQPATASRILAGTIGQAGAASERAIIGIETQSARLASGGGLAQFGQAASASLLSVVGPAAALTAGLGLLRGVVSEAEAGFALKASLDADTKAIEIQLAGLRDTNVAFQQAAQYAATYKLTQQQTTEAIGAAIPVIRNSKASMDTILGTFDQLRVRSPEKSFQDAARALGELQAGQYTSLNKIFNVPLADAKKLSDEIKNGGDAVQLVSAYLTSVGAGMDVVKSRASGAAGAMKDLDIASEQLKLALGDDATGPGLQILQTRIRATQGLINLLRGDTAGMAQGFKDAGTTIAAQLASQGAYFKAITTGSTVVQAHVAAENAYAASVAASAQADAAATQAKADAAATATAGAAATAAYADEIARSGSVAQANAAYDTAYAASLAQTAAAAVQAAGAAAVGTTAYGAYAAAATFAADSSTALSTATAATAAVLTEETQKKLASAQAAQQLAAFQATLASLGGAVSSGMYTAGQAAGILAQQYHIAYSEALRLINAQAQLAHGNAIITGQKLQLQSASSLVGSNSEEAQLRAQNRAVVQRDHDARVQGAAASARAEENYQKTLKNTAPALAHARAELAQLTVGSAAYINKQNEIAQLQQKTEKNAKAGGGGAAKLSDQTKLQNSLLASQEDYERKSEDAVTQHAVEVEKINQDFYQKMLAAQRDFDQAQLDDRASFYDSQGSIESASVRQAASAAYEAASVEAGKIAQEKGADVANKYMDAQEQVISARAKRADAIEQASNKKDKQAYDPDKAEYLKGVDAEYRKAEDAKLARIKEGGGSLEAEHQKQLDDAAAKEADALDKIGLASDRASEKKITGSERAGKKIDEEALKVDGLASKYDRLGAAGTRAGITPTSSPVPSGATPTGATTASAAPADDPIAAAIASLRDAIGAVERATRDAGKGIEGAVSRAANGRLAA